MIRLSAFHLCAAPLLLYACAPQAPSADPARAEPPPASGQSVQDTVLLIDPTIAPAVAGEDRWDYQQAAIADLTGDGIDERVVLTARVEIYRGQPLWDDGQPWQVYVEGENGARTYLYAQRLQLGTLTMRVSRPDFGEPASVILLEHLPEQLSVYEVSYTAPDSITIEVPFQRAVDPRGDTASPGLP